MTILRVTGARLAAIVLGVVLAAGVPMAHAAQQNQAIDSDLVRPQVAPAPTPAMPAAAPTPMRDPTADPRYLTARPAQSANDDYTGRASEHGCIPARASDGTYHQDDLIGAATGVFGTGAHGLADVIHDILKKQGEPNGYIVGREAGGAFVVGVRYGSGSLCQRGQEPQPVYWNGPSIGFDAGGNAAKAFVLVYNLDRLDDLYHRFPAGEGQAYLVGGFHVSYLRRGRVVLIPVRMGVGLRLGINGGYMKITRKSNWVPF